MGVCNLEDCLGLQRVAGYGEGMLGLYLDGFMNEVCRSEYVFVTKFVCGCGDTSSLYDDLFPILHIVYLVLSTSCYTCLFHQVLKRIKSLFIYYV